MAKIRLTRKLVPLLEELDAALEKFDEQTALLANPEQQQAVTIGADRVMQKTIILGIAWRINLCSKGKPTFLESLNKRRT